MYFKQCHQEMVLLMISFLHQYTTKTIDNRSIMRYIFLLLTGALSILFFTNGCASVSQNEVAEKSIQSTPDVSGEKLVTAFGRDNDKTFLELLPAELQKKFDTEQFKRFHQQLAAELGKSVSYRYLGNVEHPLLQIEIWNIRFQRTDAQGKLVYLEAPFRVISGSVDGRNQIISFNFL